MMEEAVTSPLARWENFYVIVGSSAGALTGLQFVVIALIAESQASRSMAEIRAFGSPNVMHFCSSLLISVIASAPWNSLTGPSWAFGITGAAGIGYGIMVIGHAMRKSTGYRPDFGDWMWFGVLPLAAYVGLTCAALLLRSATTPALFIVGAMSVLLLFVGIHNAWDSVTYVAITRFGTENKESDK